VLPDVPTMDEAGIKGFEATAWFGVLAPAGLPAPILARLGRELDAVARDPGFRARMAELGGELPGLTPDGGSAPEPFERFLAAERTKWAEVVRRSGAKVE
jgi:tripartite-type tricarboxylate transporter receptor subunit TctC